MEQLWTTPKQGSELSLGPYLTLSEICTAAKVPGMPKRNRSWQFQRTSEHLLCTTSSLCHPSWELWIVMFLRLPLHLCRHRDQSTEWEDLDAFSVHGWQPQESPNATWSGHRLPTTQTEKQIESSGNTWHRACPCSVVDVESPWWCADTVHYGCNLATTDLYFCRWWPPWYCKTLRDCTFS